MTYFLRVVAFGFAVFLLNLTACAPPKPTAPPVQPADPEVLHRSLKRLTDVVVYDIFTPPVASRIYAYASLAAYEAGRLADKTSVSLTDRLQGFRPMPRSEAGSLAFEVAGVQAFLTVAQRLTFSKDTLKAFETAWIESLKTTLDEATLTRSLHFGEQVAVTILERAARDQYKETRGFERYTVQQKAGAWQPTTPDYADAVEPHWGRMLPLALDSVAQCRAAAPLPFSLEKNSPYWREVEEVYQISKTLTPEQQKIARFWDDNALVSHHTGHATFDTKKMTPGGHWMAIATQAARHTRAAWVPSARAYALTAVAMFDGFLACWYEKYQRQTVRPITVINEGLDPRWQSFLQTPPFPEYPSGHSVISCAAAEVLTRLYGEPFAFTDTSELEFGMGQRHFDSFRQAAREAGLSRLYGGIHFRSSCVQGGKQGEAVGRAVVVRGK